MTILPPAPAPVQAPATAAVFAPNLVAIDLDNLTPAQFDRILSVALTSGNPVMLDIIKNHIRPTLSFDPARALAVRDEYAVEAMAAAQPAAPAYQFFRCDADYLPDMPDVFRFEFNRDLPEFLVNQLQSLIAWAYQKHMRAEKVEFVDDGPRTFIMEADTTKSRRSDPEAALLAFIGELPTILIEGTEVRTTNRAGAGTAGTRAVDGIGDALGVIVSANRVK